MKWKTIGKTISLTEWNWSCGSSAITAGKVDSTLLCGCKRIILADIGKIEKKLCLKK